MPSNQINDYGVNRFLRARLGIDEMAPAPLLAPELLPTIVGLRDSLGHEWERGIQWYGAYHYVGAVAAQYGTASLANPAGSNLLVTIERLTLFSPNAGSYLAGWGVATTGLTARAQNPLDARNFQTSAGLTATPCVFGSASVAADLVDLGIIAGSHAANGMWQMTQQVVITPGYNFIWRNAAVNVVLASSLVYSMREMQLAEPRVRGT